MAKLNFRRWELVLLAFSTLLAGSSAAMYILDFPLRYYLFDLHDEAGLAKIGAVSEKNGGVRRQKARQNEFTNLTGNAPLFDDDTVVTGPDGTAALRLDDGSVIKLDHGTMVKLSFDTSASLGGITRVATVNVIGGKVSGELSAPARKEKNVRFLSRGRELVRVPRHATNAAETATDAASTESVTSTETSLIIAASNEVPYVPPPAEAAPTEKAPAADSAVNHEEAAPSPLPSVTPPPEPTPSPSPSPSPAPSPTPSPTASPMPSPSPAASEAPPAPEDITGVHLLGPKNGTVFQIPKGSVKPEIKITFSWKAQPAGKDILFMLWRLKKAPQSDDVAREEKAREPFKTKRTPSVLSRVITEAGDYEWEILAGNGGSLASLAASGHHSGPSSGRFTVAKTFEAIQVESPLIGGVRGASNQIQDTLLNNFDVTLSWKAYPGASEYRIQFFNPSNLTKPIKTITTAETQHALNKGKIFTGRVSYRISADLPSGFVVESAQQAFMFDFLPPLPVQPEPNSSVSQKDVKSDGILFTWQKTNFTDSYDLEIARDEKFKNVVVKENLTDNFMIVESPGTGVYWWRTRSHSQGIVSATSAAARLTIAP